MFHCTVGSLTGSGTVLRVTSRCLKRFVPPWEVHGFDSPDEFFEGITKSSNPIQRMRRDETREMEVEKEQEDMMAAYEAGKKEENTNVRDFIQRQQEVASQADSFLPYGAKPERIGKDGMAAWGQYKDALAEEKLRAAAGSSAGAETRAAGATCYSNPTLDLLGADFDMKLPYKGEETVQLAKDKTGRGYGPKRDRSKQLHWPYHGTCGVVIDIDGVVYRSKKIIEGSDVAIRELIKLQIPFCFMTNGGGKTEAAKALELSELLGCEIYPDQIIMAHTPMQLLVPHYKDDNVLIGGSPACADVARAYGFKNAIGVTEFQQQHPELVPFKQWPRGFEPLKPHSVPYPSIAAVMCFSDTLDAFNDAQVIIDVCTAPYGQIGSGVSNLQTVPLYYGADDLLWATDAPLPRLGGGAFREMLNSVYRCVTGDELQVVHYGKPRTIAYKFAQKQLKEVSKRLGWCPHSMRCIAMVGDNLETDILGANAAGKPWLSVYVLSGVGSAPAATRTLSGGDEEGDWLNSEAIKKAPHYVAPSLEHFLLELIHFPENQMLLNREDYFGTPAPVALKDTYNFKQVV